VQDSTATGMSRTPDDDSRNSTEDSAWFGWVQK